MEAISKGKVSRAKGVAGIKQLSGKGINGHMFELKLTGKFGANRLLGDYETVIVNGKEIKTVIFKEIIKKK